MAEELIDELGDQLEATTLVRGSNGRFEVTVNGRTVFSKKAAGRHPNSGEIVDLIASMSGPYQDQAGPAVDMST